MLLGTFGNPGRTRRSRGEGNVHPPSLTEWSSATTAGHGVPITTPAARLKHRIVSSTYSLPTLGVTLHSDMATAPPPPPQWVLDLNSTPAKPKNASLPDPPGYTAAMTKKERAQSSKTARKPPTSEEMDTLKMKKAWEVAIGPAKQLPMNAFGASHPPRGSHDPNNH
jgi:hypothetical protein